MSSDISRQRFNPTDNFSGVLMQQGRVQLDSDWNEWNEILGRRRRSEAIDFLGRCVVRREPPNATNHRRCPIGANSHFAGHDRT